MSNSPTTTLPTAASEAEQMAGRVRAVLAHSGLEGTAFAAKLGTPYSTMRSYLSGVRPPSTEFVTAAWRELGIDTTWLLTGQGDMLGRHKAQAQGQQPEAEKRAPSAAEMMVAYTVKPMTPLHVAEPAPEGLGGHATGGPHYLSELEAMLVKNYRATNAEAKEMLRHLAAFAADYALRHKTE